MGTCYSKKKEKAKCKDTYLPIRPFFRNSVASIQSENDVWRQRIEQDDPNYEYEPDFLKETVLDKEMTIIEDLYEEISGTEYQLELLNLQVTLPRRLERKLPPVPCSIRAETTGKSHAGHRGSRTVTCATETNERMGLSLRANNHSPIPPSRCYSNHPNKTNPQDTSLRQSTNGGADGISESHSLNGNKEKMTEEQTKCIEYHEMVEIFTPLIVQNILIHDILPHLSFLDNHADIYEEMKHHSQKRAVVSLLTELNKSQEHGKWQKFMNALNACGYTYIVDNITGYTFFNHRNQTEYLKKITPMIGKMIFPRELMHLLMENELLSDTDKDNILCECNNRGDYAGAVLLLDRLPRKHRNWYMLFIKALEEANYNEVAAILRIKELMQNGRVKDPKVAMNSYDKSNEDVMDGEDDGDEYQEPGSTGPVNKSLQLSKPSTYFRGTIDYASVHLLFDGEEITNEPTKCLEYPSDCISVTQLHQPAKKTHDIRFVDGITTGRNADQVIEPPPIPPFQIDGQNTCEDTPTETLANNSNADIDEQSGTDSRTSNDDEKKQYEPMLHFNDLENEISLLQQEEFTLDTEISLLEKKSYHGEKVLDHLKKKNQLKYSIALMEKERNALRDAPVSCEESCEDQLGTDAYYPCSDKSRNLLIWRPGELEFLSKLAVEPKPVALNSDCTLPLLPFYSPRFDKTPIRQVRSDKDSGTGTIDAEYEE